MMNIERHDAGPFSEWQALYANAERGWHNMRRHLPDSPEGAIDLVGYARERAALASLHPEMEAAVCQAVQQGAAAAGAAFAAICYAEGSVAVALNGETVKFPAIGPTSGTHPAAWLTAVALALIVNDTTTLAILGREHTIRQSLASAYEAAAFWPPLMRGLSGLLQGETAVWQEQSAISQDAISQAPDEDGEIAALIAPLLPLGSALTAADDEQWSQALVAALKSHRAYWSADERQHDSNGFLALPVLGLWALGRRQGLTAPVNSAYAPAFLVKGACQSEADIVYHFPEKPARSVAEAHLFMDLQGCQPDQRQHRLESEDDTLYASYICQQAQGGERLQFTFQMIESDDQQRPSQLIDAGQFLLLADQFAQTVPADPSDLPPDQQRQARMALDKAIACLEEVIFFIPPAGERVPEDAFWTETGQAFQQQEPGRFSRMRLMATWQAWRHLRASLSAEGEETDARQQALAMADAIIDLVRPLLQGLAGPEQPTILEQIKPRPEDYAKVFTAEVAGAARKAYEQLWTQKGVQLKIGPDQTEIKVFVAPAGMLSYENELSRPFPGGYRGVAEFLNPHRTWVAWKYVRPGESSGLAFNGLVWLDDHWAWFPKPYRVLRPFITGS